MLGLKWLVSKTDKWRDFEQEAMPFSRDLYRIALWLTRDQTEAEDLVQETMFQAMRSFHLYELGTNCKAWLTKILYAHNARRIRKISRLRLVQEIDDEIANTVPFEPPVPERITDEEVLEAICNVPDTFREVLILADVEELSYKEISSILNLPMGTVMSRLHRGRKVLRLKLADYAKQYGLGESRHVAGN